MSYQEGWRVLGGTGSEGGLSRHHCELPQDTGISQSSRGQSEWPRTQRTTLPRSHQEYLHFRAGIPAQVSRPPGISPFISPHDPPTTQRRLPYAHHGDAGSRIWEATQGFLPLTHRGWRGPSHWAHPRARAAPGWVTGLVFIQPLQLSVPCACILLAAWGQGGHSLSGTTASVPEIFPEPGMGLGPPSLGAQVASHCHWVPP